MKNYYILKIIYTFSGLHGILKPLDLIQPYRLEMGTKLKTKKVKIYMSSGVIN